MKEVYTPADLDEMQRATSEAVRRLREILPELETKRKLHVVRAPARAGRRGLMVVVGAQLTHLAGDIQRLGGPAFLTSSPFESTNADTRAQKFRSNQHAVRSCPPPGPRWLTARFPKVSRDVALSEADRASLAFLVSGARTDLDGNPCVSAPAGTCPLTRAADSPSAPTCWRWSPRTKPSRCCLAAAISPGAPRADAAQLTSCKLVVPQGAPQPGTAALRPARRRLRRGRGRAR